MFNGGKQDLPITMEEKASKDQVGRLYQIVAGLSNNIKDLKMVASSIKEASTPQSKKKKTSSKKQHDDNDWNDDEGSGSTSSSNKDASLNSSDYDSESSNARSSRWKSKNMSKPSSKHDGNLGSIKLKILEFDGKSDPEAYMEWEERRFSISMTIQRRRKLSLLWWNFRDVPQHGGKKLCKKRRKVKVKQVSTCVWVEKDYE